MGHYSLLNVVHWALVLRPVPQEQMLHTHHKDIVYKLGITVLTYLLDMKESVYWKHTEPQKHCFTLLQKGWLLKNTE